MNKPLTREQVAPELTWNLGDLYPTEEAWSTELDAILAATGTVTRHHGGLGAQSATLLACLDARDHLMERLQRAVIYASLRNASDATNAANQAVDARASTVSAQVSAAISFVDPEILSLPDGTVETFLSEQPALAVHRTDLEHLLAIKPHMLGAETEKALTALGEVLDSPYMVYNRSKASDIRFASFTDATGKTYPNSFNLYEWTYEGNEEPSVRRAAWKSFCEGLVPYQNTYAATFATEISKNVVLARLRGYPGAEPFLLQDHKIPFEMYTNIVEIIQAEIAPHMRRLARLRKRVLGLDKLLYCDIKAPLDAGYAPTIGFEEAGELILEAVAPMGAEYQEIVRTAFTQRWIDRASNVGKSSGAFCASPYKVHPYILVTWTDSMRDAFVLAHELGHGAHFTMAQRHQRYVNTRPAMTFVEAPSIMNEALLARHILAKGSDKRMRRWVIMQVLGTYHHNFVTHLLEAQLQREMYALAETGKSITTSVLNSHKRAILQRFWGDAVEIDDGAAMTWMRQPHYYIGLYPYTYSVGLVAATALAEKSRTDGPEVFQRWLEVLKAGGTKKPMELMLAAGIDLSSPDLIRSAVGYVGSLVDELEASF